ncbi:acidic phospholipase A2 homolog isoform X1 [Petromyzon marinus]|uniref:Phospholipase A2 n=1 Tax=Petromyzon marinus TaxID=7757 RepID=A0AAJ7TIR1_PETMA|nr:acidic phospholipase A2 E-like isoform X2 [Petromyzon marinus]
MDRALWTAACLFGVLLSATEGTDSNRLRHRRNVVQFGNMIECRMNRQPLDYYGYGCHCGFGGKGAPVDPTDRCCRSHDCCYNRAITAGCNPYSDIYHYACKHGRITCDAKNDWCERKICECDRRASACFTHASFSSRFVDYTGPCLGTKPICR